jgi:hypothetical protein
MPAQVILLADFEAVALAIADFSGVVRRDKGADFFAKSSLRRRELELHRSTPPCGQ